jgi:hypothetical protein
MSLYVESKSDKRIRQTASVTVLILAISSGVLSYNALRELAIKSGIDPMLAFLFPITLDGLILAGSLLILYFAVRGKRSGYGLFLTALGVIASIAGNVVISPDNLTYQILHATSPVVLFLSLESLMILLRARSRNAQEAAEKEAADAKLHESSIFHHKASHSDSKPVTPAVAPVAAEVTAKAPVRQEQAPIQVSVPKTAPAPAKVPEKLPNPVVESENTSPLEIKEELPQAVKSEPVFFDAEPQVVKPASPVSLVPAIKEPVIEESKESNPVDGSQPPSKREIIRDLLTNDPDMDAGEIVDIVGGDKKYVQKLIRAERAKIAS